ncbi:MAG: Coenzyme F420 hydrogenase/dehydrogenase, beta subunit C-terminal domain [Clostridia bacterium]|nr:Coenzyme F420 hydrogenase/dehydrogenase, beta subunit C-terminal domain [Clostridia bacterium]
MEKVYQSNDACCGCGVCMTVCPKQAIVMKEDEKGFIYPKINTEICVDCGACKNVCRFAKKKSESTDSGSSICYAACNTDKEELSHSTSGGIFSAVAHEFLERGGVVAGACMKFNDGKAHVFHTVIDAKENLIILQGSKYVQSHLWECLDSMEEMLKSGRNVLFSGTPCQVDAVKNKFKKYLETQLFTIDIICHGVPSQMFFNSFLEEYQKRSGIQLKSVTFRDKKYGWGRTGQLVANDNSIEKLTRDDFSYYKYFLDGEINRESCYACPYACPDRVGDITIGDYWGVKKYDPQLLSENGGKLDFKQGVSCLIVNGVRGEELLERFGGNVQKELVDIQHVMQINTQLRQPVAHSELRKKIFVAYTKKGYAQVDKIFKRQCLWRKIKDKIKAFLRLQ